MELPARLWLVLSALLALGLVGCDFAYPEVVVVNRTGERILLKNVSFNGCVWDEVLAFGDATSPGRCLPGEDRIHVQKLDLASACQQADDEEPNWFNYQTLSARRVDYGSFHLFEITADDLEQDFSVPGPYGH